MTFGTVEMSRQEGAPVSLYLFTWGEGPSAFFAYTDADEAISHDGKQFLAIPIGRSDITADGTADKKTLDVETTLDSGIAKLYSGLPPTYPVTLKIWQGHIEDEDYKIVFSGRVIGTSREGPLCQVQAEPWATVLQNPGLRRNYQYGCPYVLYGTECKADEDAVKQTATVQAVNKNLVGVPAAWNGAIAIDRFPGGIVRWTDADGNTQIRTIVAASSDTLSLTLRATHLEAGNSIDILPGCNHQRSDCLDLHKERVTGNPNIVNYGGQDSIPEDNPVTYTKNVFY